MFFKKHPKDIYIYSYQIHAGHAPWESSPGLTQRKIRVWQNPSTEFAMGNLPPIGPNQVFNGTQPPTHHEVLALFFGEDGEAGAHSLPHDGRVFALHGSCHTHMHTHGYTHMPRRCNLGPVTVSLTVHLCLPFCMSICLFVCLALSICPSCCLPFSALYLFLYGVERASEPYKVVL